MLAVLGYVLIEAKIRQKIGQKILYAQILNKNKGLR